MRLNRLAQATILLLLACATLALFSARAQESSFFFIDKWGGINTFFDSGKLAEGDAQYAQNVLTDSGYLEKRPGNIRVLTALTGFPVKYIKEFISSGGTKYLIIHASNTVYRTDLSASPVAIATVAAANIDSVSAFNRHYFVDGSQRIMFWDGTTSGTATNSPSGCDFIEFKDERLICADGSTLKISSYGADNSWSIPAVLTPRAPVEWPIQQNDGEAITCLKRTPWGLFIGKPHSSHILKGYDNLTYNLRILDPTIGCIDNRSFQIVENEAIWMAQDGIYKWNGGNSLTLLSKEIEPTFLAIRQLFSNVASWLISFQEDWETGQSDFNGSSSTWDTKDVPGSIVPSFWEDLDTGSGTFTVGISTQVISTKTIGSLELNKIFPNSSFERNDPGFTLGSESGFDWDPEPSGNAGFDVENAQRLKDRCPNFSSFSLGIAAAREGTSSPYDVSGCALNTTVGVGTFTVRVLNAITNAVIKSTSYAGLTHECTMQTIDLTTNTVATVKLYFSRDSTLANAAMISTTFSAISQISYVFATSSIPCTVQATQSYLIFDLPDHHYVKSGTFTSRTFDTRFSTPTWGPLAATTTTVVGSSIAWWVQASTASDGVFQTLVAQNLDQKIQANKQRYIRYQANITTDLSTQAARIDEVALGAVSTGTFYSPVKFIGNSITEWKTLNFTANSIPSGRDTYQIRGGTFAFGALDSTPTWSAHTNNQTVGITTFPYFQYRILSSVDSTTETLQVDQSYLRWQEAPDIAAASGQKERRYFLSITTIAASTTNDLVLVLQKHGKWMFFKSSSQYASMATYDGDLLAGDASNNSYIWKTMQPNIYNDDGGAIRSVWVTPDLTLGFPVSNKLVKNGIWIEAARESGSNLGVDYASDKSPSFTTHTINLDVTSNTINRRVPFRDGYFFGRYLRFRFTNESNDKYFRIHGYGFPYDLEPLRNDE